MAPSADASATLQLASAEAKSAPIQRVRLVLSSAGAIVLGLAPHVLHHAGPLAGAALFAGVGGSLLFGALGLLAAIPFLIGLQRRTRGWSAPAGALVLFAAIFSISTFVVGPAITGDENDPAPALEGGAGSSADHETHH